MSAHPIDIIAAAVHAAECGCGQPSKLARNTAEIAAGALNNERLVDHATMTLAADTASRPDSPLHAANMTVAEFDHLVRAVLRSVGGA